MRDHQQLRPLEHEVRDVTEGVVRPKTAGCAAAAYSPQARSRRKRLRVAVRLPLRFVPRDATAAAKQRATGSGLPLRFVPRDATAAAKQRATDSGLPLRFVPRDATAAAKQRATGSAGGYPPAAPRRSQLRRVRRSCERRGLVGLNPVCLRATRSSLHRAASAASRTPCRRRAPDRRGDHVRVGQDATSRRSPMVAPLRLTRR